MLFYPLGGFTVNHIFIEKFPSIFLARFRGDMVTWWNIMNTILHTTPPLRWKAQINGVPKLQGVFTMRDTKGFPLDMAYELAKERGWEIDWVEAMADAARQCVLKYDALVDEIMMLEPHKVEAAKMVFASGIMSMDGATFQDRAENLYRKMWR